jgi:hypothetical protein
MLTRAVMLTRIRVEITEDAMTPADLIEPAATFKISRFALVTRRA